MPRQEGSIGSNGNDDQINYPGNYVEEGDNLPLPDLVRRGTLSAVAHENNLAELENEGVVEGMQVENVPTRDVRDQFLLVETETET